MGDVFITGRTLLKAELGLRPTGPAQSARSIGTASHEHRAWPCSHQAERPRLMRIVNLIAFDHDEEAMTDA